MLKSPVNRINIIKLKVSAVFLLIGSIDTYEVPTNTSVLNTNVENNSMEYGLKVDSHLTSA
mgnify:CR=1 FL=1